jgi:chemotaxis protein MotA
MFVLIGLAVVFGSVCMGYTMAGGKLGALMQIPEMITICGAALGSVIIGYSHKGVIAIMMSCLSLLKGNPYKPTTFLQLLQAMYEFFQLGRREGLISLEKHVEEPKHSDIMAKYASFLNNHHASALFCDTMKLVIMGGIGIYDLSDMMDLDLEAQHEEATKVT